MLKTPNHVPTLRSLARAWTHLRSPRQSPHPQSGSSPPHLALGISQKTSVKCGVVIAFNTSVGSKPGNGFNTLPLQLIARRLPISLLGAIWETSESPKHSLGGN